MIKQISILAAAALVWAPAALAGGPAVSAQATPAAGAAPLQVTLTASGDPALYHWDLGDGSTADGATVQHTYAAAGRYTATVTATAGADTSQATVAVTAYGLSLRAPGTVRYRHPASFRGTLQPVDAGARVVLRRNGRAIGSAAVHVDGSFRLRPRIARPGAYVISYRDIVTSTVSLKVKPILRVTTAGNALVGSPLLAVARLRPASAGTVRLRVYRGAKLIADKTMRSPARIRLSTSSPYRYSLLANLVPSVGFVAAGGSAKVGVVLPDLSVGAHGPSVRYLEQRLWDLHYALERVDSVYASDTADAVTAFQKLHNLDRTGSVDRRLWQVLQTATIPTARYRGGSHFEVDKERQVLFDVRNGVVARAITVSTGATGNTPLGVFHVYSKTPGFNAKLMYYSMYFIGGFAIHGYPDVPPYPASHGCVRVPLWVAVSLYDTHPYGTTVIIY